MTPASISGPRVVLLQTIDSHPGTLTVLSAGSTRNSDGAYYFASHHQRDTSLQCDCAPQTQHRKASRATGDGLFERLRRTFEPNSGSSLLDRNINTARLSSIHFLKIDKIAGNVDDGYRHEPFVLSCFGNCRSRCFLRVFYADGLTVWVGHLRYGTGDDQHKWNEERQTDRHRGHRSPPPNGFTTNSAHLMLIRLVACHESLNFFHSDICAVRN